MFAFGPVLYIFHNADKWGFLLSYVAQYYVTDHGQIGIPALANFQQILCTTCSLSILIPPNVHATT